MLATSTRCGSASSSSNGDKGGSGYGGSNRTNASTTQLKLSPLVTSQTTLYPPENFYAVHNNIIYEYRYFATRRYNARILYDVASGNICPFVYKHTGDIIVIMPGNYVAINRARGYILYRGVVVQMIAQRDGIYMTSSKQGPQPMPRVTEFSIYNAHVARYIRNVFTELGVYNTQSFADNQIVGHDDLLMLIAGSTTNLINAYGEIL